MNRLLGVFLAGLLTGCSPPPPMTGMLQPDPLKIKRVEVVTNYPGAGVVTDLEELRVWEEFMKGVKSPPPFFGGRSASHRHIRIELADGRAFRGKLEVRSDRPWVELSTDETDGFMTDFVPYKGKKLPQLIQIALREERRAAKRERNLSYHPEVAAEFLPEGGDLADEQ